MKKIPLIVTPTQVRAERRIQEENENHRLRVITILLEEGYSLEYIEQQIGPIR